MTNGVVLIIGARDTNIHEHWRDNPQVNWISAEEAERKELSSNTKAVLFTRFISHSIQERILRQCRDKKITFVPEILSTGQINDKLQLFLGEKISKPAKLPYGFVDKFIRENVNLREDTVKESQRLLPLLKEKGARTTEISLRNTINSLKRKHKMTGVPASIKSKNLILLETLTEAITNLELVKETVQLMEAENIELKSKLSKLQELLK